MAVDTSPMTVAFHKYIGCPLVGAKRLVFVEAMVSYPTRYYGGIAIFTK
jgi:hypothetical protein